MEDLKNGVGWCASGRQGAVAAGSAHAVTSAVDVLREGGTAADAACAAMLSLSVTDFGMFAIGGEVAGLYYDASEQRVYELSGLGAAPLSDKAMAWYEQHGIPDQGNILAAPVPGAPDFAVTLLKRFGRFPLSRALRPVMEHLASGDQSWHPALLKTLTDWAAAETSASGDREAKLQAARTIFYEGAIAETLCRYYRDQGHFLTAEDMAAHHTRIDDPVVLRFGDVDVYKCGSWTQGPVLLQTLAMLESQRIRDLPWLQVDSVHQCVEALKLALADRDRFYADPLKTDVPMAALLSADYARLRAGCIDPDHASRTVRPGNPFTMEAELKGPVEQDAWMGGTTVCVVADAMGNVASITPSANPPYAMCEALGIAHGNRLRCLNTAPSHPNHIAPGKRPRITLSPTLWLRDGRPAGAISVAGGDMQDQTTLCCLLGHLLAGYSPSEAVIAPRFVTLHHEDTFSSAKDRLKALVALGDVSLDRELRDVIGSALEQKGHVLKTAETSLARPVMLTIDRDGGFSAAGDHRCRYHAAAF